MEQDAGAERRIEEAFTEVGAALIQILAAGRKDDWDLRQRAAEHLGKAATDVYRALRDAGPPPAGS